MSRLRRIAILALGAVWLTAFPAAADDGERYLTNVFQEEPTEWNDPWLDSTVGPRNEVAIGDGHVGSGVRVTIGAGEHFGTAMRWRFADNGLDEPEQLWFRYYLRFPHGFPNVGKGKLPGPAGLYSSSGRGNLPSTAAEPGWSARMFFSPTYDERDADHTRIGYYLYHLDQGTNHGDLLLWDEEVATLEHGRWYCIEGQVAMNTPGEADGLLAGYVDGAAAFDAQGVRYRRQNEPSIRIDSFWFDVYFGGRQPAPAQHQIDFDSLAFGPDRLGCDDSGERGFDGGFFDDDGSIHEAAIEELRAAGVTDGCNKNGDAFCPNDGVTRGEMAKLLYRALALPPGEVDRFSDDDGSPFEVAINALAAAGVTNGCGELTYCPDRVMSRAEVAAFISRALTLPASDVDHFFDDAESLFQEDINALATAGLTHGCDEGRFCPDAIAVRSAAASFVVRAMRLLPPDPEPAKPEVVVKKVRLVSARFV